MRRRLDAQDGVTAVELLVTVLLMSIVMSIAASSAVHAMKVQRRQVAEIDAVSRGRIAMETMTREVRAANPILIAGANTVTVQVTRGNTRKWTTYTLNSGRIDVSTTTFDVTTNTQTGVSNRTILRGIAMAAGETVFTYTGATGLPLALPIADPRAVRSVTLRVRLTMREQTRTVRISDTVQVRNSVTAP